MRLLILSLFLLLTSISTQAQWLTKSRVLNNENFDKGLFSWGYFLGGNSFDYNFDYKQEQTDIQVQRDAGFNVGLLGNLRLFKYLDLRIEPGLIFAQRTLLYAPDPQFNNEIDQIRDIGATYVYLPLLLKFNTKRLNNMRPFATAGIATATNLSSNEDNPDDNSAGQFRTDSSPLFYEIGFGIDFYLPYFKFTPAIKGVFGITDELVRDDDPNSPWTGNIDKLTSRGFFLTFTFQ